MGLFCTSKQQCVALFCQNVHSVFVGYQEQHRELKQELVGPGGCRIIERILKAFLENDEAVSAGKGNQLYGHLSSLAFAIQRAAEDEDDDDGEDGSLNTAR